MSRKKEQTQCHRGKRYLVKRIGFQSAALHVFVYAELDLGGRGGAKLAFQHPDGGEE